MKEAADVNQPPVKSSVPTTHEHEYAQRLRAERAEGWATELAGAIAGLLSAVAYDDANPCGFLVSETERIVAEAKLRDFRAYVEARVD